MTWAVTVLGGGDRPEVKVYVCGKLVKRFFKLRKSKMTEF